MPWGGKRRGAGRPKIHGGARKVRLQTEVSADLYETIVKVADAKGVSVSRLAFAALLDVDFNKVKVI